MTAPLMRAYTGLLVQRVIDEELAVPASAMLDLPSRHPLTPRGRGPRVFTSAE